MVSGLELTTKIKQTKSKDEMVDQRQQDKTITRDQEKQLTGLYPRSQRRQEILSSQEKMMILMSRNELKEQ